MHSNDDTVPPEGFIPLNVPEIRGNEWKYVKECLDTGWVSSVGPFVKKFEQAVSDYLGVKHAVATVNGTAALHIALLVAGIEPGDEVLVPTLTFIAPVNAVRYIGAHPVFIDSEPDYCQIDPDKLERFVVNECQKRGDNLVNKQTGRRVQAVIPVHVLGHPCDMDRIRRMAEESGLIVVEDAAEALGSHYKGAKVGSLGDISCLSFNGNKIVTTGGGGMVVTDNTEWAEKARYLTTQAKDDPAEYIHNEIGYNYRLTNIQAAMGVAQMEMLDRHVEAKRAHSVRYDEDFRNVPGIRLLSEAPWARWNCWLCTVLVDKGEYGIDSRELMQCLVKANIQSRPLWHPIHSLPPYSDCQAYEIEIADRLYRDALSLPSSVGLTERQRTLVSARILEYHNDTN